MKSIKPRMMSAAKLICLAVAAVVMNATAGLVTPLPEKVTCAVADKQDFPVPDRVQLTGWLGTRIIASETNRLVTLDTERLLEGYYKRPGRQEWDGEHVGKWLHARHARVGLYRRPGVAREARRRPPPNSANASSTTAISALISTRIVGPRGMSGRTNTISSACSPTCATPATSRRCRPVERMADLLCKTFGDGPGQEDIITAGTHVGMAPTSVLEPMVLLYRLTGDQRYLDFCNYIVRSWEQPNGPHIVSRLLELKRVDKVGNAKAYEMLSCLNGALELYRTTGDRKLFDACRNAWQDIVDSPALYHRWRQFDRAFPGR